MPKALPGAVVDQTTAATPDFQQGRAAPTTSRACPQAVRGRLPVARGARLRAVFRLLEC
jgi:hypothetical protein